MAQDGWCKRDVVIDAMEFRRPRYVPWSIGLTVASERRVKEALGVDDLTEFLDPHFLNLGWGAGRFEWEAEDGALDVYGVTWDRTIDKDIGTPSDWPIREPENLASYRWPDPDNDQWYVGLDDAMTAETEKFSRFMLGFSLYERAWTMRGMSELLIDMIERPAFVEDLLDAIVQHNLVQVGRAIDLGIDAVYFGDDYGMQTGLIMGADHWRHFIKPRLAKMFGAVRDAGLRVSLHSCGAVAELFDDLVEIGLQMFNPFQPEVMDVFYLMKQYRGRLAFEGGMSVQKILPFGSADDVRRATRALIDAGREGGYIFAPSHSVPGDVPPENLIAMMEILKSQDGYER